MPYLAAITTVEFPYRIAQQEVKQYAKALFAPSFPQVDRMLSAFDHTEIETRNFCKPISYYGTERSFKQQNDDYLSITSEYAIMAIEACLEQAALPISSLTDIIFVSTTGLGTPSLDAHIINQMRLPNHITRTPIFGLGCAGGVAAYAKANTLALANPNAVVLVVAAELCSLTFLKSDFSKSNFIGSSLFSDGIAACLIVGDANAAAKKSKVQYISAYSKLYYDSLDVMGWDFQNDGFKVLFSQNIPKIIETHIQADVLDFLSQHHLTLADIKHFIFHPGGKKVIGAYQEALGINDKDLANTIQVMTQHGNMSSPTVLYVLERLTKSTFEKGYGLMVAMGPGFSCEMVLLSFL